MRWKKSSGLARAWGKQGYGNENEIIPNYTPVRTSYFDPPTSYRPDEWSSIITDVHFVVSNVSAFTVINRNQWLPWEMFSWGNMDYGGDIGGIGMGYHRDMVWATWNGFYISKILVVHINHGVMEVLIY